MAKPDWAAIEADFLATGMSYNELARKWGVSISTLKKKAMRGKWAKKMIETTDAMMDRIIDALQTSNDLTPYSIKLLDQEKLTGGCTCFLITN